MSEREEALALLKRTVATGDDRALREHLIAHSRLPGPRANIELAEAVAGGMAGLLGGDRAAVAALWPMVAAWCSIGPAEAPSGDPLEFLPFCGVVGLGVVGAPEETSAGAWQALAHAAADPRWRIREATAMAIRRLLRDDPHTAWRTLERWADRGGWLLLRAVAAGVAHPEVLVDPESAAAALALHKRILSRVASATDRRTDQFRTLRQGLGYTISVVTTAAPSRGFALLESAARSGDPDLRWIVRSNLGKSRLARRHPVEVERLGALLD